MTDFLTLIEELLGKHDAEEFARWAWGENYEFLKPNDLVSTWNKKHKHLLELYKSGLISIDIPNMIEVWKESNE